MTPRPIVRSLARESWVIGLLSILALYGCGATKEEDVKVRPAVVVPTMTPLPPLVSAGSADDPKKRKTDQKKGDQQDVEWVPAEFKSGAARWKDTGVYLDGRPAAFLTFGELPITLKPTWVREKVGENKRPGTDDPGWRWGQARFYKFTDYLKALGIDSKRIKEMHVYGPKQTESMIVTGKDLQTPLAQKFMFRFGGSVGGKAIPVVPEGFASGRPADKIAAVMIYIEKEPPKLVEDEGFKLDGNLVDGVPYYGDPMRGGIRVYLDDRWAATIKRQDLDPKKATKGADGELSWNLLEFLSGSGVETKKVVDIWVIRDERRAESFAAAELATLTFEASSQAKGGITLGDKKIRTNAIALHTRAIKLAELPYITSDDE